MNALRAVPTPGDDPAAQARADLAPVEDLDTAVEPGYDPATDPEAMLLCALMDVRNQSADGSDVERITRTLTAADFEDPAHARMYGHIVDLITAGQPHDFASVTGALIRSGADGAKDAPLRKRLMGIVTAGAHSVAAVHYADNVLSQSYRRSFHIAGQRLAQAAEEAPEADLFDYMVELGIRQRAAFKRLNSFRQPPTS
ncbi:DNA helicase [Rhodococcus sp. 14-2483-1-1]|uniref:DnaB-like helicase N-terminal domain-containing protein n=1 Tax=unclassified Rhodococcus (in: high G+C Gram-positive bacteria) TaxID=192944 RepID=UPI000B9C5B6B|nr:MULTISPECIES: DnaB-like helicase N-terminal domain-containing protein [unclassified Rhodococcus (in: high G+C Gram-positive bacteria)]KAA0922032.1 DNA helicase [Rhodococcus sp. ANT_H53B]OZC69789.1 DNA helicase [Rhodococcus sp. 06-470-2]OZD01932.1 DNA helicase [Rhodococcus sp. 06-235-1A]OZD67404.1 DNA helicase [Rhodococcus sp. 05-340-2]OZE27103.1 DNA helicase [Rhodococcus sp. 05-2255-1e]